MRLLNERAQVREVAELFHHQYPDPESRWADGRRAGDVLAALQALDPETATASDVDAAGAIGWVAPKKCHECGCESWYAVELGEPLDFDSCTATICERCLMKALRLIEVRRYADAWMIHRAELEGRIGATLAALARSSDDPSPTPESP